MNWLMDNTGKIPTSDATQRRSEIRARRFRWKAGLTLFLLGAAGTVFANRIAPDDTTAMIRIFQGIGTTFVALLVWWLFFSGIRIWIRIAFCAAFLGILVSGAWLTVRKVSFEGDMRPHFQFVWDPPSASEQAQAWLARNAPADSALPSASSENADVADPKPTTITILETDWARYCGPNGDREIHEPQCSFDWRNQPPKELWRHPVGDAWSSFSLVGSRLYTQEQRGPQECVVCYQADSGVELWRREDKARYETAQGATGPRATPTVTESAVFALGATGILNALNPVTGELLWQRNICTDAGAEMVEWGMSGSPLVYEQTVIVDAGGYNDRAVIAYTRDSGEIVWASGSHKAGYASPRLERLNDSLQLLIFHGDGLAGMDPATGKILWEYSWTNQYKINVAQPIRFGSQIFISSGYDSGCVMLDPARLTDGKPSVVWPRNKNMKLKFNEAVRRGDYVFGLDDGILACMDLRTGERTWKGGRYRYGQILIWGDRLIVQSEAGYVAVVEATPEKFTEVARLEALNDRTWNVPMVSGGRLYVRNAAEAACYELPAAGR